MSLTALATAFQLTNESHSHMFERFANAFLVSDYPELDPVGGKKDRGLDARVVRAADGKLLLILQSCISPAKTAPTKIQATLDKLGGEHPETFIYCTSATIGLSLDETRKQLRKTNRSMDLAVRDAEWFVSRSESSPERQALSGKYVDEVMQPFLRTVEPDRLYQQVLSNGEERQVLHYLEAHHAHRARGANLTKCIFDSLVMFALRGLTPETAISRDDLIARVASLFSAAHRPRVAELIPSSIDRQVAKGAITHLDNRSRFAPSHSEREKTDLQLQQMNQREVAFQVEMQKCVIASASEQEIDYSYSVTAIASACHLCLLWYMREQGKKLLDPMAAVNNIFDTETLVKEYIKDTPALKGLKPAQREPYTDIMPTALYKIIASGSPDVQAYLRSKADIFIMQAFVYSTPDIQSGFKKLFANDVIYLDTTVLVRLTAELYDSASHLFLAKTLKAAISLGVKVKTFLPFVQEFTAHLRGPVLTEWRKYLQGNTPASAAGAVKTAPVLVSVFDSYAREEGTSVEAVVRDIVGPSDFVTNASEYLAHEFGIKVEEMPPRGDDVTPTEWEEVYGEWLAAKYHNPRIPENWFQYLVKNDVSAYCAVRGLRKKRAPSSVSNFGHSVWLLTLDSMYWRIGRQLSAQADNGFNVAMSTEYLVNFLAAIAMTAPGDVSAQLPATLIFSDSEIVPADLRELVAAEYDRPGQKRYKAVRRIRELLHNARIDVSGSGREGVVLEEERMSALDEANDGK